MMSCAVALFHERPQNGGKDLSGELHFLIYMYTHMYTHSVFFFFNGIHPKRDNTGKITADLFLSSTH